MFVYTFMFVGLFVNIFLNEFYALAPTVMIKGLN